MRPLLRRRRPLTGEVRLKRMDACVHVDLTPREARALVRGLDLVMSVLRPELFPPDRQRVTPPPMAEAQAVIIAAAERAGVDIGLFPRELVR